MFRSVLLALALLATSTASRIHPTLELTGQSAGQAEAAGWFLACGGDCLSIIPDTLHELQAWSNDQNERVVLVLAPDERKTITGVIPVPNDQVASLSCYLGDHPAPGIVALAPAASSETSLVGITAAWRINAEGRKVPVPVTDRLSCVSPLHAH